jgi:hypothetical protein
MGTASTTRRPTSDRDVAVTLRFAHRLSASLNCNQSLD